MIRQRARIHSIASISGTMKPIQSVVLKHSVSSSDIYIHSDTSRARNHRRIVYRADVNVEETADYPEIPGGLYTILIDRTVNFRKDLTLCQDRAKFSLLFPPAVPNLVDASFFSVDVYATLADDSSDTLTIVGSGNLTEDGWVFSCVTFDPDGDSATLRSPWTAIDIILVFEPYLQDDKGRENILILDSGLRHTLTSPADCIIVANDGKQFHTHWAILSAGSPVFGAMVQHDTAEKQEAIVRITDISSKVMEEFLVFVYNRTVDAERVKDLVEDLYHAADKYDVPDLRAICEDMMCKSVDATNAIQRLNFAHNYGINQLKTKAINFISENKTSV